MSKRTFRSHIMLRDDEGTNSEVWTISNYVSYMLQHMMEKSNKFSKENILEFEGLMKEVGKEVVSDCIRGDYSFDRIREHFGVEKETPEAAPPFVPSLSVDQAIDILTGRTY